MSPDSHSPWRMAAPSDYESLELQAHELLAGVPLHDVWQVDLPGGGDGRTIADVQALMQNGMKAANPIVKALFWVRSSVGRVLGWDRPPPNAEQWSFVHRLSDEHRRHSVVAPGSADGPFTALYVHPGESVSEIRNATVHAFLVRALETTASGYRMVWAIHVQPVGRGTAIYMALIDPFRRRVIYPSILRRVHRQWIEQYDVTGRVGEDG